MPDNPQLSDAEAVKETGALQFPEVVSTTRLPGHVINIGASLSTTETACMQVETNPFTSITVQVTFVTPIGYVERALLVVDATPQLSLVVGEPNATLLAVQMPASVFTVMLVGQLRSGG